MNQQQSEARQQSEAKQQSRGVSTDMSPAAVTRRLQICSDLSALCSQLGNARPVGVLPAELTMDRRDVSADEHPGQEAGSRGPEPQ